MAQMISPIGTIILMGDEAQLTGVRITSSGTAATITGHPLLSTALIQLQEWFAGERQGFDLPLAPLDSSEGQALRAGIAAIPYGQTQTYGAVAAHIGSAARAVGQACKTNAFPLIIPCHRVVSATGPEFYSAGQGARTKGWLLDFEQQHLPPNQRTRLI